MILSFWLVATALAGGSDFQLQTTDGQTYYGELVGLDAQGVAFETSQERLTVPLSKLSDVSRVNKSPAPETKPAVWIELIDGSQLVAAKYSVAERVGQIKLTNDQAIELPTAAIRSVRFQQFAGEMGAQWGTIAERDASADLIVIHKKGALDYQPGVLGDITDTTIGFRLDDEEISVKRSKVAGLVYFHAEGKQLPGSLCQLVDAAGSRLEVAEAKLSQGKELEILTPAGLKRLVPLAEIAALTARVQYLSDLEPESATWRGYVTGANVPDSVKRWFRPRFNEAVDGGDLKIGAAVFAKGIAMSSSTELVYRLPPGEFKRLIASAGIDSRGRPRGAVRLAIYGDDRALLEADVLGSQEAMPIDLDLTGVNRLRIVVDFGANGEVMDLFDLVDARILQ
ncbi:MAG TPA: NPCBM/NEW2 domain-containing protein [Pirellulales bacterium]|nr:NPCBM/NEW2 domain-containing protein [Pirellulales bacterium]